MHASRHPTSAFYESEKNNYIKYIWSNTEAEIVNDTNRMFLQSIVFLSIHRVHARPEFITSNSFCR